MKNKEKSYREKKSALETAEEPAVAYILTPSLLTGKTLSQMTAFEKIDIIKSGVSKNDLVVFKKKAALDYDQLAKALSVTRATLINKKGKEKFAMALSERLIAIADIYSFGYDVFEDEEKFNRWVLRPNRALGGIVPFDLLDTQYGREEVRVIIGRINYGLFS